MAGCKLLLVDGNNAICRAAFAVPPMHSPDGRPTNAVHGLLAIIVRAVDEFKPEQVVVAWDRGKPPHRTEALVKYKAHRPPMDPDLKAQFPIAEDILSAIGVPQPGVLGWEADDVVGHVARCNAEAGGTTVILSGDKDMLQLVDGNTTQARPANGGGFNMYDEAAVLAEFGVRPDQYVDFIALKGDPSDGIPGVTGIGPKGASKLIAEYGDLETLLERCGEVGGKNGRLLDEQRDQARMSRDVATIVRDLEDVYFDPEDRWGDFSLDAETAFKELGLTTMWGRIRKHATHPAAAEAPAPAMASLFDDFEDDLPF